MATILLADDERIFKVVQGTLLRRQACRLLKATFGSLPALAVEHRPDLVIVPASTREAAVDGIPIDLLCLPELQKIPAVILDMDGTASGMHPGRPVAAGRGAPVEIISAAATADGPDLRSMESRLAELLERHLDLEGRGTERIAADLAVHCALGKAAFAARTKDISSSGLFLKTEHHVRPGDRVEVSFRLPALEDRVGKPAAPVVEGSCVVVRLVGGDRDDPDLIPGAGLRFVHLSAEGRAALDRFALSGPPRAARSAQGQVTI